jgi:hypothetical protein
MLESEEKISKKFPFGDIKSIEKKNIFIFKINNTQKNYRIPDVESSVLLVYSPLAIL